MAVGIGDNSNHMDGVLLCISNTTVPLRPLARHTWLEVDFRRGPDMEPKKTYRFIDERSGGQSAERLCRSIMAGRV